MGFKKEKRTLNWEWKSKIVRPLACHRTPVGLSPALLVGEHYSLPAPHHPLTTAPCRSPEKHLWGWKGSFQILLLCFRVTSSQANGAERSSLANLQPTDIWGNMAVPIPNVLIKNPAKQPWGQASRPMGVLSWTEPAFDWMHKKAATAFTLVRSIQTSGDGRRMCSKDATCTIEMKKQRWSKNILINLTQMINTGLLQNDRN